MKAKAPRAIEVAGARTHNLKGVSCRVPIGAITVVTGPSGSGKSSLAFDTLYAEGQRRFVESMSTYARQFLERMERPDVDRIDHLLPALAIEQKSPSRSARSTVGTATEIHDVLRLLFAAAGTVVCPACRVEVRRESPRGVVDALLAELGEGARVLVLAPRPAAGLAERAPLWVRSGLFRAVAPDGSVVSFDAGHAASRGRGRSREARRRAARPASGRPGARGVDRGRLLRRGGGAPRPGGVFRARAPLPARPRVQLLRPPLRGADPGPLLLQLAARCLPDLPGLRTGGGPRRGEDPPRPRSHASRASLRAVQHAGLRQRLPRPRPRLPAARNPPRRALERADGAREGARLGRRRRLVRREGALHVPRDEALQGARPRDDREVPRVRALPGLPRRAADPRSAFGPGRWRDPAGALRAAARRAPREAPWAPARGDGEGARRLARGGPRQARRDARRRRALLPLAVADDADPLRRRGAEGPARSGARQRPHRDALRPGRADRRAPPVRHGAPSRGAPAPRRRGERRLRRRARPRRRPRGGPRHRPRAGRRGPRRPARFRGGAGGPVAGRDGDGRGAAGEDGARGRAACAVSARPPAHRRCAGEQPGGPDGRDSRPASWLRSAARRGRESRPSSSTSSPRARFAPSGGRKATHSSAGPTTGSRGSRRSTTSSSSTSRPSAAPPARTRRPTRRRGTRCAPSGPGARPRARRA